MPTYGFNNNKKINNNSYDKRRKNQQPGGVYLMLALPRRLKKQFSIRSLPLKNDLTLDKPF
jgi:hypothetical protein